MITEMSLQEVELVSGGTNVPAPACPPEKPVDNCGGHQSSNCSPLRGVFGLIFGLTIGFSFRSRGGC